MSILGGSRSGAARLVLGLGLWISGLGCGDDEAVTRAPDAASLGVIDAVPPVGNFDGSLPEPPVDSGTPPEPDDAAMPPDDAAQPDADAQVEPPDHGASISGVTLTNAPHIGFTNAGTAPLVIVSASFELNVFSETEAAVRMYGDLENQGTQNLCIPLSDVFSLDGGPREVVVVEANPYDDTGLSASSLSMGCIPPGGRGVWHGIILDVLPSFVDDTRQIRYAFSGLVRDEYQPSPFEPEVLYADPVMRDAGYVIAGILRTRGEPIYNVSISFFGRRSNGLIFAEAQAFLLDLGTLAANTTLFYESNLFLFSEEEPESVTYHVGFIEGADPTPGSKLVFEAAGESELGQRVARSARDRRALRETRAGLAAQRSLWIQD